MPRAVKKKFTISISGIVIGVLVVALVISSFMLGVLYTKVTYLEKGGAAVQYQNQIPEKPQDLTVDETNVEPISDNDHVLGSKNAEIALIEYADLECPYCKSFHDNAKQLIEKNQNVVWVFRHFPLRSIHPTAQSLAMATECAYKLGGNEAFWNMTDKIFENQPGLKVEDAVSYAGELGLDATQLQNCLDNKDTEDTVNADYQSGVKAGISGTPGNILFNLKTKKGIIVPGAVPVETLEQSLTSIK